MKKYLDAARPRNGHTLVSFRATTFELPWPQTGRAGGWTSWGTTAVAHTTVCAVGATAWARLLAVYSSGPGSQGGKVGGRRQTQLGSTVAEPLSLVPPNKVSLPGPDGRREES
jgi:hypothetical protein